MLAAKQTECPFCGQAVDEALAEHIRGQHDDVMRERGESKILENQRTKVAELLEQLRQRLGAYHERHAEKASALLQLEESMDTLKSILSPKYEDHFGAVEATLQELSALRTTLDRLRDSALEALAEVESSVAVTNVDPDLLKVLG